MIGQFTRRLKFSRRKERTLANDFPKKSFGRRFIRAHFDGEKIFLPRRHESGSLYSAVECNCPVDIAAGTNELSAGAEVEMILL